MAMNPNAFTAALVNWSARSSTRWTQSIDAIRNKQYTYADMMADWMAAVIDDPVDFWTDLVRNSGIVQSSILIPIASGASTAKSEPPLVVPAPTNTKITSLVLLGGSGADKIEADPTKPGGHVRMDTVGTYQDKVQVVLFDLKKMNPALKTGQYLGILYEGTVLVANVVVHVS